MWGLAGVTWGRTLAGSLRWRAGWGGGWRAPGHTPAGGHDARGWGGRSVSQALSRRAKWRRWGCLCRLAVGSLPRETISHPGAGWMWSQKHWEFRDCARGCRALALGWRGGQLRLRACPGPGCRVSVGGCAWVYVLQTARGRALSCLCFSTPAAGGSVDLGSSLPCTNFPSSPKGQLR